jgi:hypothetical protein
MRRFFSQLFSSSTIAGNFPAFLPALRGPIVNYEANLLQMNYSADSLTNYIWIGHKFQSTFHINLSKRPNSVLFLCVFVKSIQTNYRRFIFEGQWQKNFIVSFERTFKIISKMLLQIFHIKLYSWNILTELHVNELHVRHLGSILKLINYRFDVVRSGVSLNALYNYF